MVVVLIVVGLLAISDSLRAVVNANQGAVSAILTAMLVILYFGQFHLQSRQLRFQNASHVEIQKYNTDGKDIEIWLSNLGNGVATNIEIKACIDFEPTAHFAPDCASIRLRRVDEESDYKERVGNSLQAGEHNVRFVGQPVTEITPDGESDGWGLVAATGRLASVGVEEAKLDFFVTSKDLLGHEHSERIFGWAKTVELESGGMNIEEIKSARGSIEIDGESVATV